MVGLVVISHSRTLAAGVAELARVMGVGEAVVEPAGGDADGGLGTSIDLVERAVAAADRGDGVLLLTDIGSSVLTAKTYLEDAAGAAVRLADAPLVEGAVAAASMAATGAGLDDVLAAAESARDHRKT
ncbi:dihydroxyacetone kinase phosphoryl donor subunit DhaM [Actinomadura roseirufa]|uniref:dihydroxyacetone kinase phosphoryl donor subunit DhaM n=1 Tax=Actinomadura roseirufa TaxID=2094049 RepID=UPI00104177CB|nr:dihydroxyacetone kinase phosphoryl donor subunit DhaM [Actinomadura roseirufa]